MFFVHPCRTSNVLSDVIKGHNGGVEPILYLELWMGAIGSHVGLYFPAEMSSEYETSRDLG
jgi:Autophagocytosis associated protein, active-site domain